MIKNIPVSPKKYIAYDKLGHQVDAATLEYPDWLNSLSQENMKDISELRVYATLRLTAAGHVVGVYDVIVNERAELVSVRNSTNSVIGVFGAESVDDYILCHFQDDLDLQK
jgi:hypothetical protein